MEKNYYFKPKYGAIFGFAFIGLVFTLISLLFLSVDLNISGKFVVSLFLGITWFIVAGFYIKTLRKAPALMLSDEGITNNSIVGAKAIFISWKEIMEIKVKNVRDNSFILAFLKTPNDSVEKQNGSFAKLELNKSMKVYGTPIRINYDMLKNSKGLTKEIMEGLAKFQEDNGLIQEDKS